MKKRASLQQDSVTRWLSKKRLPRFAQLLLRERGAEVFLVGGALRDVFLGRMGTYDIDLLVRGVPLSRLTTFLKKHGRVDPVGRTFGVLKFVPKGQDAASAIDIALPREDLSFGTGGYRDVETRSRHTLPVVEDLRRRDFTVNAMAWDIGREQLVDPFHGGHDVSKRILRAVGDPARRFGEDYTRILRMLRFAVTLDFTVHAPTWHAAKALMPHVNDQRSGDWVVPRELVAREVLKSLAARPHHAFSVWDAAGAWKILVPEIEAMKGIAQPLQYHTEGDVWEHTRRALEILESPAFAKKYPDMATAEVALAVLLHDIGKPPTMRTPKKHGTDRIRFDGHDKMGADMAADIIDRLALMSYKGEKIDISRDRVVWAVAHHLLMVSGAVADLRPQTIERYFLSPENPGMLLRTLMFCDVAASINANGKPYWQGFRALERRIASVGALRDARGALPKPLLSGLDIMKTLAITPGPRVGELLAALRDMQLRGKIRTKAEARHFLKKS